MTDPADLDHLTLADRQLAGTLFAIERYGDHKLATSTYAPPLYLHLAHHLRNPDNRKALIEQLQANDEPALIAEGAIMRCSDDEV